MNSLRFTETNSADDSKGRTWGLEGNLFWFIAGGAFSFVVILLFLFSALKMSFVVSLMFAAIPLLLLLVYVFTFRHGKPPAYDIDCLDLSLNGAGFGLNPIRQPAHPLCSTKRPTGIS
ncbi:MAG: hypothetical protein L0Z50_28515 [Verrucomicrobiales bacterium]|nr:hypothetical protein [Verrucomicrobiales bacterium]